MTAPTAAQTASLPQPEPAPPNLAGLMAQEQPPWDWSAQNLEQRAELTRHLTQFVEYFNARYAWNSDQTIPPCWVAHGALIEELTTLMWSRWAAFSGQMGSADAAQTWHTYSLPAFLGRLAYWVGPQTLADCRAGNHQPPRRSARPQPRPGGQPDGTDRPSTQSLGGHG